MPSFSTIVISLLVPAAAVLAGAVIREEPDLLGRDTCKTTYSSQQGDTCDTIDKKYGLVPGTIFAANSFLTCSDVWVDTPICVPDGPYACSKTYTSVQGDTCESIEKQFTLPEGSILAANTFLTCSDIWSNTPICVPNGASTLPTSTTTAPGPTSTPATCKSTYNSAPGDTCDSIEKMFNLVSNSIKSANSFVTCNDIWAGTPLCIPDGPYKEDFGCTIQTYYSQPGDTWCVSYHLPRRRASRLTEFGL